MKAQDIVILLKILLLEKEGWRYSSLAEDLQMSSSTVFSALKRAELSGLYHKNTRTVHRSALLEFLIHGFKYVFPTIPGKLAKGVPTAHSANPLAQYIQSDKDVYVWKSVYGTTRGQTIIPLYETVPQLVQKDIQLYELLTLIDALRVGKAREKEFAIQELTKRIDINND
jgi:predicted DNA-binding transcriptional regulator